MGGRTAATPAKAEPRPVSLDDFGDVLTNRDLARLLHCSEGYLALVRHRAKRAKVAPALPDAMPIGLGGRGRGARYRYRKVDVAEWMATGRGSARRRLS